jgi:phage terminase Nu1 subunit (DNA packaging protein)
MATQKEVAEHLDLSTKSVAGLVREGVIPPVKGPGGLDLDACRVAYIRNLRGKAAGRIRQAPAPSADGLELNAERARLAHHQANKAELDEQTVRGDLVRAEDVTKAVSDAFRRVRARLLSLPSKITPVVLGSTDAVEVKNAIEGGVMEALAELTREPVEDDVEDEGNDGRRASP